MQVTSSCMHAPLAVGAKRRVRAMVSLVQSCVSFERILPSAAAQQYLSYNRRMKERISERMNSNGMFAACAHNVQALLSLKTYNYQP